MSSQSSVKVILDGEVIELEGPTAGIVREATLNRKAIHRNTPGRFEFDCGKGDDVKLTKREERRTPVSDLN